jgi:hypothetical protein
MNKTTTMSLKSFTEEYTRILQSYTADELRAILISMANEVKPAFRSEFICNLLLKTKKEQQLNIPGEEILEEIEALVEEIEGQANEEPDWSEYDDEDSLGEYSQFIPSVSYLFNKIETLFDHGQYELARQAYKALFTIFEIEDDYGRGIQLYDIDDLDREEVRARYLRSIYLSEKPDNRVKLLLDTMQQFARADYTARPKLYDLINISVDPLPDFIEFVSEWIQITQKESGPQFDAWFREAVFLLEGVQGLERLAKSEGVKRPRVYVEWINALSDSKNYSKALDAITYALELLPKNQPIRAAIGDLKVFCGEQLQREDILFDGQWISFEAKPDLSKLIEIYNRSKLSERQALMNQAVELIKVYKQTMSGHNLGKQWERDSIEMPASPNNSLLMHAYLLSGQLEQAFKLAKEGQPLGWSSADNAQPLFIAYCLIKSTNQPIAQLPNSLWTFFSNALNNSNEMYCYDELENQLVGKIERGYQEVMSASNTLSDEIISWCMIAVENRISAIVSNQHRGAYDRAALLTAACAEALKYRNPPEAFNFFQRIKNKFPRHSAFQAELRQYAI